MSRNGIRLFVLAFTLLAATFLAAQAAPADTVKAPQLEKAKVKIALKQYDQAVNALLKAMQEDPKNPEIPNFLGVVFLQTGNFDAARSYFKRAIRMDKNYARAYNNLAAIYHVRKQYKTAIKQYKKAVEKDPQFLLAYYNMANAYFAQKKYLQAVDTMHKLVQIDPDYLMKDRGGLEIGSLDIDAAKRNFYYAKLYAQVNDLEKVVYFLKLAVDSGFKDFKTLREDLDFAPFLPDPRIQALLPQP